MSFEQSPFAKSLYLSGTPKKSDKNTTSTTQFSPSTPVRSPRFNQGGSNTSSPRTPLSAGDNSNKAFSTPLGGGKNTNKTPTHTPNAYKPSTPSSVPTGSWQHPSLSDIRRRTVNKELVVQNVFVNGAILCVVHFVAAWLRRMGGVFDSSHEYTKYAYYFATFVQCLCGYNVLFGVFKLFRPQEKFDDLPVTPSQRKLLGLPVSPTSQRSTPSPPKYLKSSPQTRVSPRPSPLSKSAKSSNSPLSNLSPSPSKRQLGAVTSTGSPAQDTATTKMTTTTASTTAANTSAMNKIPDTPSPANKGSSTGTPFTPTGRYMYMSDSPNRRSSLRRV